MDVKNLDWSEVEGLRISPHSKITHKKDLNHIRSTENIQVQFSLSGDVKGMIHCYLCLDDREMTEADKNYLYPLFTESMNILIGRLISTDKLFSVSNIQLSAPRFTLYSKMIDSRMVDQLIVYELKINDHEFNVILNLDLTAIN